MSPSSVSTTASSSFSRAAFAASATLAGISTGALS
jgi:hypothetical protein